MSHVVDQFVRTPAEEAERQHFIRIRDTITALIRERIRQDAKWGEAVNRALPLTVWYTVLGEEVGEVGQAILKHDRDNLRAELVQMVAVGVAMLECLKDAPWGVNDGDAG